MSETTSQDGSPKRARVRKTAAKKPRAARSQAGATPADTTPAAGRTPSASSTPSASNEQTAPSASPVVSVQSGTSAQSARQAETSAVAQSAAVPRSQPQSAELQIRSLQLRPIDRMSMIATAAYFRAERRRFAPGHELEDWVAAEAEIEALLSAPNRAATRTEGLA